MDGFRPKNKIPDLNGLAQIIIDRVGTAALVFQKLPCVNIVQKEGYEEKAI